MKNFLSPVNPLQNRNLAVVPRSSTKWGSLICRPVAAQMMADDVIALFDFNYNTTKPRLYRRNITNLSTPTI